MHGTVPSLSSFFPRLTPEDFMSTIKAEIPLCFNDLSVVAMTIAYLASWALVIQALAPLRIKSPLEATLAVVEAALESDPF